MGIGDELMAAGEARRRAAGSAKRFLMLDKYGREKWHPIWHGNPHVARPGQPHDGIIEYVNKRRPYIVDETVERRTFRPYKPSPATIALDHLAEPYVARARGAVVFNPTLKEKASPNKEWGLDRWKLLVRENRHLRWLQISGPGVRDHERVPGAEFLYTERFLDACGAVSSAAAVVVHEGALHHAAAAFGTPAVVIYGGYITPRVTGYAGQKALFADDKRWPLGCGMRIPCGHCAQAMAAITPAAVYTALTEVLKQKRAA